MFSSQFMPPATTYKKHAQRLKSAIAQSDRVLLTLTTSLDGDSLGSMVAMAYALDKLGRRFFCYVPEDVPPMFHYLTKHRPLMREMEEAVAAYPLVMIFDTGDIKRTPLVADLVKRQPGQTQVVNIDHHPTVIHFADQLAVDHNIVDSAAASTTEMLVYLFDAMDVQIDAKMATALLTGILTDTTHFANPNTTDETMAVAARLMAKGADHQTITRATMRSKSLGTLKLWGRALSRLAFNPHSGVVSTVVTLQDLTECQVDDNATMGIANFLNTLSEGKVALVLKEEPGGFVKGSLRTTSDVNVAEIAQRFGGGGHAKAAAFKVRGKLVETGLGWQVEELPASTESDKL
jgi:phosphoesterase RecJ-like protein